MNRLLYGDLGMRRVPNHPAVLGSCLAARAGDRQFSVVAGPCLGWATVCAVLVAIANGSILAFPVEAEPTQRGAAFTSITSADDPPLTFSILGKAPTESQNPSLRVARRQASFSVVIRIANESEEAQTLQIAPTPLVRLEDAEACAAEASPKVSCYAQWTLERNGSASRFTEGPWKISGHSDILLRLTGFAREVGTYEAQISIIPDAKRGATRNAIVSIDRQPGTLPRDLWIANTPELAASQFYRGSSIALSATLHNTSGDALELLKPRLVTASYSPRADKDPVALGAAHRGSVSADCARSDGTLVLSVGAYCGINLMLNDVADPGFYIAKLAVTGDDGGTEAIRLELYVKYAWWIACIMIGAGTLVGFLVLVWLRSNLNVRRLLANVPKLQSDINTQLARARADSVSVPLLLALRQRVTDFQRYLRAGANDYGTEDLNTLRSQLDLIEAWLDAEQDFQSLDAVDKVPGLQARRLRLIDQLQTDAEKAEKWPSLLRDYIFALHDAHTRGRVRRQCTALEDAARATLEDAKFWPVGVNKHARAVEVGLIEAKAHVEKHDGDAAQQALLRTRRAYVWLLHQILRSCRKKARPGFFPKKDWQRLIIETEEGTNIDAAGESELLEVEERLNRAIARHAQRTLVALQTAIEAAPPNYPTRSLEYLGQSVRNIYLSSDPKLLVLTLRQILDLVDRNRGVPVAKALPFEMGSVLTPVTVLPAGVEADRKPMISTPPVPQLEPARLRVRWNIAATALVGGIVSVWGGMVVLWAPRQDWGAGIDLLVALLWGSLSFGALGLLAALLGLVDGQLRN